MFFLQSSCPANYVTKGEPADLDRTMDKTNWFNQVNAKVTKIAKETTNMTAMSLDKKIRNSGKSDRHCWSNWEEWVPNQVATQKACRTLKTGARNKLIDAVVAHVNKYTSWGRRLETQST